MIGAAIYHASQIQNLQLRLVQTKVMDKQNETQLILTVGGSGCARKIRLPFMTEGHGSLSDEEVTVAGLGSTN